MGGIDFYTTPASAPARMVLLLAKHLNVELNKKEVDLLKGEQLKPEFVAINPQHTIPTLVDNGFVITESRAMLSYLQNKYGKDESLYSKVPQEHALVDMRMFFDTSTLYARFADAYYPVIFGGQSFDQGKLEKLDEGLGYAELYLKDGFIAGGTLTIADFSVAASLSTIAACHDVSKFPRIVAYLKKCRTTMKGWDELNQAGVEVFAGWFKSALNKPKA